MAAIKGRFAGAQHLINFVTFLILATIPTISALSQQYCSSQNTGSDFALVLDIYQSNGACSQSCAGYAFAVVQYKSCWCSNYIPADTTSTGSCNVECPGYPSEKCGDESAGLFGYVALGKAPLGTKGAAASSSQTEAPSSTQATQATQPIVQAPNTPNPSLVTVQDTVTASQSIEISYVSITPSTTSTSTSTTPTPSSVPTSTIIVTPAISTTSSSPTSTKPTIPPTSTTPTSTTPSTTSTSTTSSSSSTWTPTPFMSVMTVTGQAETLTVTPTAPPPDTTTTVAAAADNKGGNGGFWSNKAKVGGIFFLVAVAIIAIIAAIIFFLVRRKRPSDTATIPSTTGNNTPQRRPSRLSQMGLIGGSQQKATVPSITTSGWGPGTSAEKSPADTLNADRRSSYPRVVDQRLEPTALWNPLHDTGSHVSIRSFRDDQDYSRRMLRIANPDE